MPPAKVNPLVFNTAFPILHAGDFSMDEVKTIKHRVIKAPVLYLIVVNIVDLYFKESVRS